MSARRAGRDLDAAGITDPALRAAYLRCRALHAAHGRTYYLACRLLAPDQRPAVHALYGFARLADDLVDNDINHSSGYHANSHLRSGHPDTADSRASPAPVAGGNGQRRRVQARLEALGHTLRQGLTEGHSDHPVLAAVVHTATRYRIDAGYFEEFLCSMRMDLTVTDYATIDDLGDYMRGSAEVIGLQMLPVLGTRCPPEEARPAAATLGAAFQLTNFLRDVGEDLDRGRIYLPADVLAAHGVDRDLLRAGRATGRTPARLRAALACMVARNRKLYRVARPGIALLAPRSQPCVRTAYRLYSAILDLIEQRDYDVLNQRVVVPHRRRLAVALPALAHAALTRASAGAHQRDARDVGPFGAAVAREGS